MENKHNKDIFDLMNFKNDKSGDLVQTYKCDKFTLSEIYSKAHDLGLWVCVDYNPVYDCHVVKQLTTYCHISVAAQIAYCLSHGKNNQVNFQGSPNKISLRAAIARKSKKIGHPVKTQIYGDYVICTSKKDSVEITDEQYQSILKGEKVEIVIREESEIANVRAKLHYFQTKNNIQIKTRYINNKLTISKKDSVAKKVRGNEIFVDWIKSIPFDVPLPVPEIEGLSVKSMDTIAKRNFGCMCLLDGLGKLTKHQFRLSKEKGFATLRCRGEIKFISDKTKVSDLESHEWEEIEDILKQYGVTSERLV